MRQTELAILIVVSVLTGYGCKKQQPQVKPNKQYKIAFVSNRDGNSEIYVMNADGSEQKNLTNVPGWDIHAQWSPDGKKIAFVSSRNGNLEIYIMNADGTGQKNLTNSPGSDVACQWSPEGKQIAFVSNRDGNYEIYVMNADGSGQTNVTNDSASDSEPHWLPDGNRIAFVSDRSGKTLWYITNIDGTGQPFLTNYRPGGRPYTSPDGKKVVSKSGRIVMSILKGRDTHYIYVSNPDGSDKERLTDTGSDWNPVWSPVPLPTKDP